MLELERMRTTGINGVIFIALILGLSSCAGKNSSGVDGGAWTPDTSTETGNGDNGTDTDTNTGTDSEESDTESDAGNADSGDTCDNCTDKGAEECSQGSVRTCATDSDGCLVWEERDCQSGVCFDAKRCASSKIEQWGTSENDTGIGVATDDEGNLYVNGTTQAGLDGNDPAGGVENADYFLTKWSAGLEKLWTEQWGSRLSDSASDVAVTSDGWVYSAGLTYAGEGTGTGAELTKRDLDGNLQWTVLYGEADTYNNSRGLALDGDGNVVIVGVRLAMGDPNQDDIFAFKTDGQGIESWSRIWGGEARDSATAVSVDGAGNAYIAGTTYGVFEGNAYAGGAGDGVLIKVRRDGTTEWAKSFGTSGNDRAMSIVLNANDEPLIVGTTDGDLDGQTNLGGSDAFLTKWSSDGEVIWTKLLGTDRNDEGHAIGMDAQGNIYIAGTTTGELDETSYGDIFLLKLDPDGNVLWPLQWGVGTGDGCNDLAVTPGDEIAIVGSTPDSLGGIPAGGRDIILITIGPE